MKPLPEIVTKGVFTYRQIQRNEILAVYEQRFTETGYVVGHEVFYINQYPEREIMGNVILAHEAMPGDNQFGVSAWSTGRDVSRAIAKFDALMEYELNKPLKA